MNELAMFAQQKWYLIVAALIALYLAVKLIKHVIKWLLVIAIAAALLLYGTHYSAQLKTLSGDIAGYSKDKAVNLMLEQSGQATYHQNADGTFTVKTPLFEMDGKLGSDQAQLFVKGQPLGTIQLDGAIKAFLTGLRQSNGQ